MEEKDLSTEKQQNSIIRKVVQKERWKIICLAGAIFFIFAAAGFAFLGVMNGSRAVKQAFDREKEIAEKNVYHQFYEEGFSAGEKEYHVKNRAAIKLGNIRETSNLEVLSVSDIAFMIDNPTSDNKNVQSWIQVPGTGIYTVNLAAGEFLVDDERLMVFVRVPKPELLPENINIDHSNVQILRFSSNAWLSSIRDGEQLAGKQLNEARTKIQEDINSNLQYYEYAKKSAETILDNLIRSLNYDIPELKVQIEFF